VRVLIAVVLLLSACAPFAQPAPLQEPTTATSTSAPATPRDIPVETATPETTPVVPTGPQTSAPIVRIAETPFTIAPTFALARSAIAADDEEAARFGIHWYLQGLDRYRDHGDYLPVSGNFGTAVAAALSESRTPGVQRTFVLESLRIEGVYRKPWGTRAVVDVRATIVDRALNGSAPDQRETGLLRLTGERRLQVIDAWDVASGRWFNGRAPDEAAGVGPALEQPIASFLHSESWQSGMPLVTYLTGAAMTPFLSARAAHLATFDRTTTASRSFEDVTGTIERFDTFAEIAGGMATVRVAATVVTTDATGRTERQTTGRRVKVFFGNWVPEVVDEELTPGVWRSGGDLALIDIDVSRA
jgi:hypothetical protein